MTRKIVQISTYALNDSFFVYALCDDGTLWCSIRGGDDDFLNPMKDDDWGLVANVPQMVKCPDTQESKDAIQMANKFFNDFYY